MAIGRVEAGVDFGAFSDAWDGWSLRGAFLATALTATWSYGDGEVETACAM